MTEALAADPFRNQLRARREQVRHIITEDPAMQHLLGVVERIAPSDLPVLVEGETGTGKELVARHLHASSLRAKKPFIAVNCAALPKELCESTLFGHERGAFTGAHDQHIGKFGQAHLGTLLLDEVHALDQSLQAKLLRVLQEFEIDRVGGRAPIPVDVRIVATASVRLRDLVAQGLFLEALYYRLNVIPVVLPPLRDRPGDVDVLADYFLERTGKCLTPGARAVLQRRRWPGNVRELQHTLQRAALLTIGPEIGAEHVASEPEPTRAHFDSRRIEDVEREAILQTLEDCAGNRTHAARILGISIRTLRIKLRAYGVAPAA